MKHALSHACARMAGITLLLTATFAAAHDSGERIPRFERPRRQALCCCEHGCMADTNAPSFYESVKHSIAELMKPVVPDPLGMDFSVVLDMNLYHDTSAEGVGHLKQELRGFPHHHGGHGHDHGENENGFNLRHVEVGLSASVDPYFRAWVTVAGDEESVEFEEAVIQTTCLPYGFALSGGKLKSGIGRLNRQHSHDWDMFDQPLVYDLFFGHHGLIEKGAQFTWLVPTPFYLLIGAEVFNGDNEQSFAVGESDALRAHNAPRLWTGFIKAGPDLGDRHALQFGISALAGRHQMVHADDEAAEGHSTMFGADFVYKYDAKRSQGHGNVTVQGEYFYRDMDLDGRGEWSGDIWRAKQDGYYVQGLYGFLPRWRGGVRWDHIGLTNDVRTPEDGALSCGESYRMASMLDWKFSKYSLLRAQVGHGWYDAGDGRERAWEFALQWQITFGEHAEHDF